MIGGASSRSGQHEPALADPVTLLTEGNRQMDYLITDVCYVDAGLGFDVVGVPPVLVDEHYRIQIDQVGAVTVTASSDRGRARADAHLQQLMGRGALQPASYDEFPRFAVRGVIEGFYGTPWTHEERLDMIEFMALHRMNTFVYSPKDDVFTRRRWREPYPEAELAELAETVRAAGVHQITFDYGISPGLSIRYTDPHEVELLLAKFAQVGALGVSDFLLLLDDIPATLQHPADLAGYDDLVSAQIDLIDQVRRGLDAIDPRIHLTVCPTYYNGRGDEPYISRLGAQTDPRIDLLWTGREICSPRLELADAATFVRSTHRPVVYWDNYPVNDVAMTAQLHLGAYLGRDPHLFRFSRGVIANPMERPESSKIALATIADYLWDPEGYDPQASWEAAIAEVAGPQDAEALLLFADNVRTSCLQESDAHLLTAALEQWEFQQQFGDPAAGREQLAALATRFVAAADQLLAPTAQNQVLAAELRPWLLVFRAGACQLQQLAIGLNPATHHGDSLPPVVFGDVLDMFVRGGGWIDMSASS